MNLKNKEVIRACLPVLQDLFGNQKEKYIELFFQEKDLEITNPDLSPLLKVGLIKKIGKKFRANVFIFPLADKFIICDFLISFHRVKNGRYLRRKDDVWPIFAYESHYIAKKTIVRKGDEVLDLATGSGIIAIFCAEKAGKVIATDINPKALNYAQFNAILNGLEDKIDFRRGDLFKPVKDNRFDLIVWNGPTIATPDTPDKYPVYCFGGADGLDFTKRFIKEAPLHLKPKGRMQWLDPSLGDQDSPQSLKLIEKLWSSKNYLVDYEQRVKPSLLFPLYNLVDKWLMNPVKGLPIPLWIKPLTKDENLRWIKFLQENGFTHIWAGMYRIYTSQKFKIVRTKPEKIYFPRMNYLPQDWHFLGISRIKQLLRICENY